MKRHYLSSFFLVLLGVLAPIVVLYSVWIPETETYASWFQRSGSVLVIFSILSQLSLLKAHRKPVVNVDIYRKFYNPLSLLTVLLAIIGTAIWGYGDLFM